MTDLSPIAEGRCPEPSPNQTACFQCGTTTDDTPRSKYCGDGSDKDNSHRWMKIGEMRPFELEQFKARRKARIERDARLDNDLKTIRQLTQQVERLTRERDELRDLIRGYYGIVQAIEAVYGPARKLLEKIHAKEKELGL